MRKYITAGLAIRRGVRRFLLLQGIDFHEEKGWLDSVFYLKCSDEEYKRIGKILSEQLNQK